MESEFVALEMDGNEAEWLKIFLAHILLGMKSTIFVSMHYTTRNLIFTYRLLHMDSNPYVN